MRSRSVALGTVVLVALPCSVLPVRLAMMSLVLALTPNLPTLLRRRPLCQRRPTPNQRATRTSRDRMVPVTDGVVFTAPTEDYVITFPGEPSPTPLAVPLPNGPGRRSRRSSMKMGPTRHTSRRCSTIPKARSAVIPKLRFLHGHATVLSRTSRRDSCRLPICRERWSAGRRLRLRASTTAQTPAPASALVFVDGLRLHQSFAPGFSGQTEQFQAFLDTIHVSPPTKQETADEPSVRSQRGAGQGDHQPLPEAEVGVIPLVHLSQEQNGYVTEDAMRHIAELDQRHAGRSARHSVVLRDVQVRTRRQVRRQRVHDTVVCACSARRLLHHAEAEARSEGRWHHADGLITLNQLSARRRAPRRPVPAGQLSPQVSGSRTPTSTT